MNERNGEWEGRPTRQCEQDERQEGESPSSDAGQTDRSNTIYSQEHIRASSRRDESIGVGVPQDSSADVEPKPLCVSPPREPQLENEDEDRGLEQRPSHNTDRLFPNVRHKEVGVSARGAEELSHDGEALCRAGAALVSEAKHIDPGSGFGEIQRYGLRGTRGGRERLFDELATKGIEHVEGVGTGA